MYHKELWVYNCQIKKLRFKILISKTIKKSFRRFWCSKIANLNRTEAGLASKWGRIVSEFQWCKGRGGGVFSRHLEGTLPPTTVVFDNIP